MKQTPMEDSENGTEKNLKSLPLRFTLLPLFVFLLSPLIPQTVLGGKASYYLTNESGELWYIKCDGPLTRAPGATVEDKVTNELWYSPGESIFLTGPWGN